MTSLRLTPRAVAEAKRKKRWWQRHRNAAPDLFDEELEAALARVVAEPTVGAVYRRPAGSAVEIRRVLMRKTPNHVYYRVAGDQVEVLSVWGSRKGRPPTV